jgi:hypothetical protein
MDTLDREIQIMSRDYSSTRRLKNKWKHRSFDYDSAIVAIKNEIYLVSELLRRKELKENIKLLMKMNQLWKVINPFHLPGVSKNVYYHILKFLYKYFYRAQFTDKIIEESVQKDLEIEFRGRRCLYFSGFYDSMFDIVDQYTSSKVISEYLSTVSVIINLINDSKILNMLDLHNKYHCQGERPHYYYWMKEILQINKTTQLITLKNMFSRRISPKTQSYKKMHLEKLSPLSSCRKSGKINSFLLEEIIQGRNKYLTVYNQEKKN